MVRDYRVRSFFNADVAVFIINPDFQIYVPNPDKPAAKTFLTGLHDKIG
jgi:hypothetical protein